MTTTKTMMSSTATGATTNGGGGREGRDLISELPDPILHSILSYLDMSTVLETSFLSKRWRYLWTTLPFLNFSDMVYNVDSNCNNFLHFVDRVLIFRNQNSNIQTFHFSHGDEESDNYNNIASFMCTWIHILIRSYVQEIHIKINSFGKKLDSFTLPKSLITCKSLTTLKLDFGADFGLESTEVFLACVRLEIPVTNTTMICLPALITLHLENILLGYSVQLLISKCLALETLIVNCCFDGTEKLNICNSHIKSLTIKRKLTEFCEINVSAPKLTSLSCTNNIDFMGRYSFANVSSLVHAKIITVSEWYEDDIDPALTKKNVIDFLRGICNVRSLTLSVTLLFELVTEVPEHLESLQIKPFCNLRYLMLKTSLDKHQINAIIYLLKHCPNLQYLVLKAHTYQNPDRIAKEDCWEADLAPQCTMHHLEFVQISNIIGNVNELEFLKFLLNNAVVLKNMIVLISKKQFFNNNNDRFRKFHEKLMKFHGESSSSILFYEDAVWSKKRMSQRIHKYFLCWSSTIGGVLGSTEAKLAPQCMMIRYPSAQRLFNDS